MKNTQCERDVNYIGIYNVFEFGSHIIGLENSPTGTKSSMHSNIKI